METIDNIKEQLNNIKIMGMETIPAHLEFEWEEFINKHEDMEEKELNDFLELCQTIEKYLLMFRNYTSGRKIAQEFYQEFNYKSSYTKELADIIATFAPFPENVQFIQGYYESFIDITESEEKTLTEKIDKIRTINDIMNLGLNYDNAKFLGSTSMLNIDLNGEIIPVMRWTNDTYCGINEKGELVSYEQIGDDFDVLYIIKQDWTYNRLINRHQKLTSKGIIPNKTIITDSSNKVISIDNTDVLVNPSFYDISEKVAMYQSLCQQLAITDSLTSLEVTQEAIQLSSMFDEEHTLCAAIFDKLEKEGITKNPETK